MNVNNNSINNNIKVNNHYAQFSPIIQDIVRGNNNFPKGILIFNCDFPFTSGIPDLQHCLISNKFINCSCCNLHIFKCGFSKKLACVFMLKH